MVMTGNEKMLMMGNEKMSKSDTRNNKGGGVAGEGKCGNGRRVEEAVITISLLHLPYGSAGEKTRRVKGNG